MVFERGQLIMASLLCQLAESNTQESATGGPHHVHAFSIKEGKKNNPDLQSKLKKQVLICLLANLYQTFKVVKNAKLLINMTTNYC